MYSKDAFLKKTFCYSLSIVLFSHNPDLFKEVLVFPDIGFSPAYHVMLLRGFSSSFLAGDYNVALLKSTQFPWHSLSAILRP